MDEELKALVAKDRFAGVVLVGRGDSVLFHKAYGVADREVNRPHRPDTRFNVASLNKLFTATAILRLAQEGKLDLDAPIAKYLGGFPEPAASKVTVRHLLRMRSGWEDYSDDPAYRSDPKRLRTIGDYMEIVKRLPLRFEPGTREAYSNAGYEVLGAIIEAVTGRSYYDVVRELVLRPAGMRATGYFEHVRHPTRAVPYMPAPQGGDVVSTLQMMPYRGTAAGGAYSTAEDLRRFLRALVGGKLLNPTHTELLLHQFAPEAERREKPRFLARAGGTEGANAVAGMNFGTGDVVIVLANLEPPAAEEVDAALRDWLNRQRTQDGMH